MKNFISKLTICSIILFSLLLTACGGTSSSPGNSNGGGPNPPGSPTFTITAAAEYPVSGESSIYVIVTNNSKVNATNINYTASGTGISGSIDIESQNITSISGTCTQTSISAGAVCSLPVAVLGNSNPGSITIRACLKS